MKDVTPTLTAIKILKAWFLDKSNENRFPVDCRGIAEGFGIKVHGDNLEKEFEGGLFIDSDIKAIIYNKNIAERGRINFTIGHELGHYFLHRNCGNLQCSFTELGDFGTNQIHSANIEREANCFAVELLMPAFDFIKSSKGSAPSVSLLAALAERYQTSLTATAYRMVELAHQPLALVIVKGGRVHQYWRNEQMKETTLWLRKGELIPSIDLSKENVLINSEEWLDERHAHLWSLEQSSVDMPKYGKTLILITADSKECEQDLWDDALDSVDLIPKW